MSTLTLLTYSVVQHIAWDEATWDINEVGMISSPGLIGSPCLKPLMTHDCLPEDSVGSGCSLGGRLHDVGGYIDI